jgi:acetaldehyde dehydrogenase/alcohol dehydrogenase
MAHQLGAAWGIPHGRANALLTPHVLSFNAEDDRAAARYAELADLLGAGGGPEGLAAAACDLRERVRIPGSIAGALDVPEADFAASLEAMARNALADLSYATNPRRASAEDVRALYRLAWEG